MEHTQQIKSWFRTVFDGNRPTSNKVDVADRMELSEAWTTANECARYATANGKNVSLNGTGMVGRFVITFGDHNLFVTQSKTSAQKKGVTETSRENYHAIDSRGQAAKVAKSEAELTLKHGFVTDSMVAEEVGIPAGRVSARRNEFERVGAIIDGVPHFFTLKGKVVCPVTKKTVRGWAMERLQSELF